MGSKYKFEICASSSHMFGALRNEKSGAVDVRGFYPLSDSIVTQFSGGPGVIQDDFFEYDNCLVKKTIDLTPFEYLKMSRWINDKTSTSLSYKVIGGNCISFVEEWLKSSGKNISLADVIGYEDIIKTSENGINVPLYMGVKNSANVNDFYDAQKYISNGYEQAREIFNVHNYTQQYSADRFDQIKLIGDLFYPH